ncbi:unnamed protein product [Tuber melanosporum]|jgi:translation initiation factor eIF-2B subunit alpha|uniref:Translation initiation factor eIF2B subunit alpha n=1 Tax=Tuber melanosporum (strain Mel28) TaxID=656061 RepID=D5G5K5_TUBMM|nr:uncharacterized protein GSTUM_00004384001 [Tuber melanosporum]CAZ79798.1 unnamed protein product [Tuber melanosporum]
MSHSTIPNPNDKPSDSKPGIVYFEMSEFDILGHYSRLLEEDPSKSMPIAAIESLCALCDGIEANTIHELLSTIQLGSDTLKESVPNAISLTAGCDLFTKFITRHSHDDPRDFDTFKRKLQSNGHLFAQRARKARSIVAENGLKMVMNNPVIFVHGYSRCIMAILLNAKEKGRKFKVICTETRPSCQGLRTAKELRAAGVSVAVIDDNAVTYAMNKATFVLVGAEGTLADASIINVMGTQNVALAARNIGRPFYVATETHKFVDMFPVDQYMIPVKQNVIVFNPEGVEGAMSQDELTFVDYVDPKYITSFVTETGLMSPTMVGDKIIATRLEG